MLYIKFFIIMMHSITKQNFTKILTNVWFHFSKKNCFIDYSQLGKLINF